MTDLLRIDPNLASRRSFHFRFNGQPILAYEGETVAAALLAAGIRTLGLNPVDNSPRGLFCAMGLCQECVVAVDRQNVEACRLRAVEALTVETLA